MHREESEELTTCADCGATVSASAEPCYGFGAQGFVCFECALRRGGSYDSDQDRWSIPPDVADLQSEAYERR
jgi:hypothetical protein